MNNRKILITVGIVLALLLIVTVAVMMWTDHEPELMDVAALTREHAENHGHEAVTGYATTATLMAVVERMLDKRGGYLSNDIAPPWVFLDNMPNWEFGVLTQSRDLARAMRNDFSRSQSQSTEDEDLAEADPLLHYQNDRWLIPATEGKYEDALAALERYLTGLSDTAEVDAQFFARADNLRDWLSIVEKRLGSLSQRLSASVGQVRLNTDLANEPEARQATRSPNVVSVKTPWLEIDDVFFEARGTTWALIHFLRALEMDFADVLEKKNARVSLRQIIRELEATQESLNSPMVLNGSAFGFFANHSLVMANYIARANAAIIDLNNLLTQG